MLDRVEKRRVEAIDAHDDSIEAARALSADLESLAPAADADAALGPESLECLHRSGLALAVFSRRFGGAGLLDPSRALDLARILRLVGAGDLSVARLFEGHVNAVSLVERYGTDSQASALAEAARVGGLSGVWNAEGREPLTAVVESGALRLQGQKILASGLGLLTHPIVTPKIDAGVVMVLLDPARPGRADLSGWTPTGMRASATGTVDLSGITLPSTATVGQAGDYLRQPFFSGGAWRFCAVHLGAAERLLDLFRAHLRQRGRTGDPYQKQRIAAAAAACLTARFWVERAADRLAAEDETAESVVAFTNLTRMVTERACLDVLEAVQRGVGLGAFIRPDPIERIARDLATYLRQPVPDAAMADAATYVLASDEPCVDLWAGRP